MCTYYIITQQTHTIHIHIHSTLSTQNLIKSVYGSSPIFGSQGTDTSKLPKPPKPAHLSAEFVQEHPFNCELPDGTSIHFSQSQLNFFEIFFSSKKYPQYKTVLDNFCEEKGFEDLQSEVMKTINQVDIDIRREVMSSIVGTAVSWVIVYYNKKPVYTILWILLPLYTNISC